MNSHLLVIINEIRTNLGIVGILVGVAIGLASIKKGERKMKEMDKKFDIMTEEDLALTEGGFIVTTSTAIAWGVLGVAAYMYGRYLGSRR